LLSNFNISGTGIAAQFNAPTFIGTDFTGVNFTGNNFSALSNFRINGSRVLAAPGTRNTFVGLQTGTVNTGADSSFFGFNAGNANVAGNDNSFFGSDAGGANTSGTDNSFFGSDTGDSNTSGNSNSFFGRSAGHSNTTGDSNTFVGTLAGQANTTGNNNTIIGKSANVGQSNLTFATAIGAGAVVSASNSIVLGRPDGSDLVRIPGLVDIDGKLAVHTLDDVGIGQLCIALLGRITTCSSSLRYKTGVASFLGGLDVVRRLRPIRFTWKEGGMQDIGFAAEEVNEIEPLLATRNKRAQIEGVKYGQLTTVLVNAVKEQQAQIEQYQMQLAAQQRELAAMKRLLCRSNHKAALCQSVK
jgi:stage V sporulation protein SpoVS